MTCVDNAGKSQENSCWSYHAVQCHWPRQRQQEDERRQDEEHQGQVDHREPAILSSDITQLFGHDDGPAHERDGVKDEYSDDVEEEVNERDLDGGLQVFALGGKTRQDAGGRCANVAAQGQGVGCL